MKFLKSLLRKNFQIPFCCCCNGTYFIWRVNIARVCEVQEPAQVESDKEDGDGTIETYFNRIKKYHWNSNVF